MYVWMILTNDDEGRSNFSGSATRSNQEVGKRVMREKNLTLVSQVFPFLSFQLVQECKGPESWKNLGDNNWNKDDQRRCFLGDLTRGGSSGTLDLVLGEEERIIVF